MINPSDELSANRATGWAFLGCLSLGIFLRLYNFSLPDLWIDEYVTWWVVAAPSWAEVAERATLTQGQSPFYYLVVKLFTNVLGEGAYQLRLPSALFGIATLVIGYPLALELFRSRQVALIALAVFSVNERLIWFSQNARPYALALFLALLSFHFFLRALRSERTSHHVGYALTVALLIYCHYLFGCIVLIQVAALVLVRGWRGAGTKAWLLTFLLIAILCAPSFGHLLSLYQRRQSLDWIPLTSQSYQWLHLSGIVKGIADPWVIVVTGLALLVARMRPMQSQDWAVRRSLILLLLWLTIPIAAFWLAGIAIGVVLFDIRYVLFIYPPAFYLLAWLMGNSPAADWRRWLPCGVFVIATVAISLLPHFYRTGAFRHSVKWGWGEAARLLAKAARPGDLVVFYSGLIEANLFADAPQAPHLQSYVAWPLAAHLPADRAPAMVSLPFNLSDATRSYLRSVEARAANSDRVWVVGADQLFNYFNYQMLNQYGFVLSNRFFTGGIIEVTLLQKANAPPR